MYPRSDCYKNTYTLCLLQRREVRLGRSSATAERRTGTIHIATPVIAARSATAEGVEPVDEVHHHVASDRIGHGLFYIDGRSRTADIRPLTEDVIAFDPQPGGRSSP